MNNDVACGAGGLLPSLVRDCGRSSLVRLGLTFRRFTFHSAKFDSMRLKIVFRLITAVAALAAFSTVDATCPGGVGASTTPNNAFTVNVNGTVVHLTSGLMWKQCNEGLSGAACDTGAATSMTWYDALTAAKSSTFAGYSDWRLPNKKELESLIDNTCFSPAINAIVFPGTASAYTQTSTTLVAFTNSAWIVSFDDGGTDNGSKASQYAVRLVRGGQSFDLLASAAMPNCALDVSGDSAVTHDIDGVLLLRYLLGFRGATLITGGLLGPGRADAQAVQDFIGTGAQFDVFGRSTATATAMQDGLVLTRLMLGVPDAGLLTGIAVPTGATFTSGSTIRANVNARCGTNY